MRKMKSPFNEEFLSLTKKHEMVKVLNDGKIDFRNTIDKYNRTYLHRAVSVGNVDLVDILLDKLGESKYRYVHWRDKLGFTPLNSISWCLVNVNYVGLVNILLDNGADPNTRCNKLRTPIFEATEFRHVEAVKILIGEGANLHFRDIDGYGVFDELLADNRFNSERQTNKLAQLFIDNGLDPMKREGGRESVFSRAVEYGLIEFAKDIFNYIYGDDVVLQLKE